VYWPVMHRDVSSFLHINSRSESGTSSASASASSSGKSLGSLAVSPAASDMTTSGELVSSTLFAAVADLVGVEGEAGTGASAVTSGAARTGASAVMSGAAERGAAEAEGVRMLDKLIVSRTRSIWGVMAVSVMVAVDMLLVGVARNDTVVRNTG
jgi:hypothetical protein